MYRANTPPVLDRFLSLRYHPVRDFCEMEFIELRKERVFVQGKERLDRVLPFMRLMFPEQMEESI